MRSIHVESVAQRESGIVIVKGPVCRCVVHLDARVGQAGNELLNPAGTLDTRDRRTESRGVPGEVAILAYAVFILY